ncbi:MAG: DNA-3-methyladenine glycosylase [Cyclobacteriaceae bacterium]
MIIATPTEFRFNEILHFLTRSPKELLHTVDDERVYKLLEVNGKPYLVRLSAKGNDLKVEFLMGKADAAVKKQVTKHISDWFDLDKDLKPFYKLAKTDPYLKPLVKKHFGYRIVGQPDLYESLVWAVLGQQINLQFAYTLKGRFVQAYGTEVKFKERSYYLFPNAASIVNVKPDELLDLQFSNQKARYVIEISKAFVDGVISQDKLARLSLEEAKEQLIQIKGIGNWTANYALMKTFRYADAFPLEDAGLKNAVKQCLGLDRAPTWKEIEKVFEKYKGWEAYATLYLWRML